MEGLTVYESAKVNFEYVAFWLPARKTLKIRMIFASCWEVPFLQVKTKITKLFCANVFSIY
jgi:hypothetical protein